MGTMKKDRSDIGMQVNRRQAEFVRHVNDMAIFIAEAFPQLRAHRRTWKRESQRVTAELKRYDVPGAEQMMVSKRSPTDLALMFGAYLNTGLYRSFLIAAVSEFESYLFDTMRLVLAKEPKLLAIGPKGGNAADSPLNLEDLIKYDKDELLRRLINRRLDNVSYFQPVEYLKYVQKVIDQDTKADSFQEFVEIKASRDIYIHANGIANETYLEKVGDKKRANDGEELPINADYFQKSIKAMKQCCKAIADAVDRKYPHKLELQRRMARKKGVERKKLNEAGKAD